MVHFILQKRKVPLDQLCKGLNTLGILKLVKSHPEQMQKYFIKQDMPLKIEDVIGLLTIDRDELPLNDKSSVAHNFLLQGIKKLEQGVLLYFHNIIYFQLTIWLPDWPKPASCACCTSSELLFIILFFLL